MNKEEIDFLKRINTELGLSQYGEGYSSNISRIRDIIKEKISSLEQQQPSEDIKEKWLQVLRDQPLELYHAVSEQDMKDYAWWLHENLRQYTCDYSANQNGEYLKLWRESLKK